MQGDLIVAFQYLKEAEGYGFKLKEGRFKLVIRKKLFIAKVVETQEEVAQRSCQCPIPESTQGQTGSGF